MKILQKLQIILLNLFCFFINFPIRIKRFLIYPFQTKNKVHSSWISSLEWPLLLLDCLGIPEILETAHELFNWNLRSLTKEEKADLVGYFRNSIFLDKVRLNSRDSFFAKRLNVCYVTFYTINFYKKITFPTLVHEMVHIWQFQKFGSPYIVRSLLAQRSKEGYNYGGYKALECKKGEGTLLDYNYEQMADLIMDGYIIHSENQANVEKTNIYLYYINQLSL